MTEVVIPRGLSSAEGEGVLWSTSAPQWLRRYGIAVGAYIVAMFATGAGYMGDTVDYVASISAFAQGVDHYMWDFAHLLWRPLGWLLYVTFAPITAIFVGESVRVNVTLMLIAISWVAGLLCVILIHSLARSISGRTWIANVVAFAFIFTQGFLNYAHAGTSYVLALALLLIGFHLLIGCEHGWKTAVVAGMALAGAVCLWVPYLFAVPAAVFAPLVLFGVSRARVRRALETSIVFALLVGIAYGSVIVALRLHTVDQVRVWISWSSHGTDFGGVKRAIFGFARSWINMGNDGLLIKRYLLSDPFNPVSVRDLIGASLWKLGVFYAFVLSLVITLFRSHESKRVLALLIINCVPVMGFAVFFAGSDIERYLPLYPMMFLATASGLSVAPRASKSAVFVFIAVLAVTNSSAMAKQVLDRKQDAAAARIGDLLERIDDRTMILVPNWQDELISFTRTYPLHPLNRSGRLHLSALVTPGTAWNVHWCEDFASRVLSTWREGGVVWISNRALSQRPRAEWNWCEGDDRRVSWRDFPATINRLDFGEVVGGEDGFVQILPSPKNEQFLTRLRTADVIAEVR